MFRYSELQGRDIGAGRSLHVRTVRRRLWLQQTRGAGGGWGGDEKKKDPVVRNVNLS